MTSSHCPSFFETIVGAGSLTSPQWLSGTDDAMRYLPPPFAALRYVATMQPLVISGAGFLSLPPSFSSTSTSSSSSSSSTSPSSTLSASIETSLHLQAPPTVFAASSRSTLRTLDSPCVVNSEQPASEANAEPDPCASPFPTENLDQWESDPSPTELVVELKQAIHQLYAMTQSLFSVSREERAGCHDAIDSAIQSLTITNAELGSVLYRPSTFPPEISVISYSDINLRKRKRRTCKKDEPAVCQSCGSTKTPEWRKGPDGPRTLCNACGLHYAKLTKKLKEPANSVKRGAPETF